MTGPRTSTTHPLPRRPWLLLPFLATVAFLPLGCSDQPMEPITTTQPDAAVVSHPVRKPAGSRMAVSQSTASKPLVSFSVAQTVSAGGPSVLILADTDVVATSALATSLTNAGLQVTVRPAPEYTWDGTNPSLSNFDVVVHLNGSTYDVPLDVAGQTALADFVANGGGYLGAEWNGFESQPQLVNLTLQGFGGDPMGPEQTCGHCEVTYQAVSASAGHPVLAGLPASFTFTADGHDAGPQIEFSGSPSTVLMQVPSGRPAVLVRELGAGRIVNFSFAPNYYWDDLGNLRDPVTLQDPTIQQLYVNAVQWAASGSGTIQSQSITFGLLEDKVYGDPAFTVGASASSGLPVHYTSSGTCNVDGTRVTLNGAGSCTITAHQPGNDEYEPADDVSQSFNIAKAPATITLSGLSFAYDGTVKSATATTAPAELSLVTLKYSQSGVEVDGPRSAGSYHVVATLDNPNYQAPAATGTLTINQGIPTIQWQPGRISVGAPLGPAQLNAIAYGVGGVTLSGTFAYDPPEGTRLKAGTHTLWVHFTPSDASYTGASKSVIVTVELGFKGFHPPVKNQPTLNVTSAGGSIPIKFSVAEYSGLNILSGTPTSVAVTCGSGPESTMLTSTSVLPAGLSAQGYSYTYMWRTDASWAGTCRKFTMRLSDGSIHEAMFRFPARFSRGSTTRRILGR